MFVQSIGTTASLRGAATRSSATIRATGGRGRAGRVRRAVRWAAGGAHRIEGIGIGYVPPMWGPDLPGEIVPIATADAEDMARRMAREEGLFAGTSSGAYVLGAIRSASVSDRPSGSRPYWGGFGPEVSEHHCVPTRMNSTRTSLRCSSPHGASRGGRTQWRGVVCNAGVFAISHRNSLRRPAGCVQEDRVAQPGSCLSIWPGNSDGETVIRRVGQAGADIVPVSQLAFLDQAALDASPLRLTRFCTPTCGVSSIIMESLPDWRAWFRLPRVAVAGMEVSAAPRSLGEISPSNRRMCFFPDWIRCRAASPSLTDMT